MLLLTLLFACAPTPRPDAADTADPDSGGDTADSGGDSDSGGDTDSGDTDGGDTDSGGDSGDCDPTVATIDLPTFTDDVELLHLELDPAEIDAASDSYARSWHSIYVPNDPSIPLRDELFLFLPGTANQPDGFDNIAQIAARAGYPVIVLAWDSEEHPGVACSELYPDDMETCRTLAFQEKAYGDDVSDVEDNPEADSVVGRLTRLLAYLDAEYPAADAGRWLDGDTPRWSSIAVGGFSQGSLMSGLLSKDQEFARVVLLAGGCDAMTLEDGSVVLASWCSEPRATPADRTWALSHLLDEPEEDQAIHAAYGLTTFGDYADAGAESPAYCTDTHQLYFTLQSEGDDPSKYHLATAHDTYMPIDDDGVPELAEDYWYLLTAE